MHCSKKISIQSFNIRIWLFVVKYILFLNLERDMNNKIPRIKYTNVIQMLPKREILSFLDQLLTRATDYDPCLI